MISWIDGATKGLWRVLSRWSKK